MIAALDNIIEELPQHWYHDPTLKDNNSWTVAMYAAYTGRI